MLVVIAFFIEGNQEKNNRKESVQPLHTLVQPLHT